MDSSEERSNATKLVHGGPSFLWSTIKCCYHLSTKNKFERNRIIQKSKTVECESTKTTSIHRQTVLAQACNRMIAKYFAMLHSASAIIVPRHLSRIVLNQPNDISKLNEVAIWKSIKCVLHNIDYRTIITILILLQKNPLW